MHAYMCGGDGGVCAVVVGCVCVCGGGWKQKK